MFINISPIRKYKDFRWLFISQCISLIGNMISYVVIPFQIYHLTKSNLLVGSVSLIQLFSVIIFGILGGAYADRWDRRKLIIISEWLMMGILGIYSINAAMPKPSIVIIFILVGIFQAISSFHRPAMTAMIQKIVKPEDYKAVGSLRTFVWSLGSIIGPAIGGILISNIGFAGAYFFNILTFLISLYYLNKVSKTSLKIVEEKQNVLSDIQEGFKFVIKNPKILGSYIIDIVAMIFAYPVALFPAMSENWGGARAAGILYAAMSIGAFFICLFSGWTEKVVRNGRAVIMSAALWAFFTIWLGFANHLYMAVFLLILAGGADAISGIFRQTIWNQSIPNHMRGRLSGIEMISYMAGPLLGNARAGYIASLYTVNISLTTGGILCFFGIVLTTLLLPKFWKS